MAQKWIEKYLTESEITGISNAVHQAELGTTGEIVPMIVHRSSAIRHVPVILGLSLALLFFGVEVLGLSGWYLSHWLPFLYEHWLYQVLFLIMLLALAWGLSYLHPVQRLLTSDADEKDQVFRRAQLEFFLHRLNHTDKKTAVLIFVSVMERRAVILADEGIARSLPQGTWEAILKSLTGQMHKKNWAQGFQEAIHQSGELLKTHFPHPAGSDSANEISNHLIIKE